MLRARQPPTAVAMYSSKYLELLIEELEKLPSIGLKSAQRLALHLLRVPKEDALRLAEAIRAVRERVGFCTTCGNFSETDPCALCGDPRRDPRVLCVVEQPVDVLAFELGDLLFAAGFFRLGRRRGRGGGQAEQGQEEGRSGHEPGREGLRSHRRLTVREGWTKRGSGSCRPAPGRGARRARVTLLCEDSEVTRDFQVVWDGRLSFRCRGAGGVGCGGGPSVIGLVMSDNYSSPRAGVGDVEQPALGGDCYRV